MIRLSYVPSFWTAIVFCIVVGCLVPTDVFAQSDADEAEVAFVLGNDAYRKGHYEEAIGHYFRSNRLAPNQNVTFNIAKCYEALAKYVEAYRYYAAFQSAAKSEKDKKAVSPALARIRKRIGLLDVTTSPAGASLYVERVDLGAVASTPGTVALLPGARVVVVDKPGYKRVVLSETLVAGAKVKRDITLQPILGTVRLEGPEQSVQITTDEYTIEASVPGVVELPIGPRLLEISSAAHTPIQLSVDLVEGDKNSPLSISLQPIVGTLVMTSSEVGAQILVDGEVKGFTPAVVDLSVGEHQVTVAKRGFQSVQERVVLSAGERVELDIALDEVSNVRAASGVEEDVAKAPASVSVVTSQEIEAFGYRGTADALTGTRSIYFTNDLTYRLIGIRGVGPFGQFGNRVLVQLDGHALNDSWIGASFHEFELMSDIYNLDRIEVVRGPNSVLYGSGAFQGVINMVSPDVTGLPTRRIGATAISDGVFRGYGSASQPFNEGGAQLSAGYVRGQPIDYVSDQRVGSVDNPSGVAKNVGDFDAYTFRGIGTWKFLKASGFFHRRDQGVATGSYETLFGDGRTREADQRFFGDIQAQFRLSSTFDWTVQSAIDGYQYEGDFPYETDDGGVQADRFSGVWLTLKTDMVWRLSNSTRLTVGFSGARHLANDATSANDEGQFFAESNPFTEFSAFTNVRQSITSWLDLYAGARFDVWSYDALPTATGDREAKTVSNVNPRVVAIGSLTDVDTLKVMAGRGFRAPSVYELSYNDDGQTQISNPEIDPENILSAELEYRRVFGKTVGIAGVFYNRINNVITQLGGGDSADPFMFENTDASLQSIGAEFEVRRPFFRGWMVSANYAIQRSEAGDFSALFDDPEFVNSPIHTGSLKFAAPLVPPALRLSTRLSAVSGRIDRNGDQTPVALLWDVAAYGKFPSSPVHYTLRVENVLDWTIEHPTGDEIDDVRVRQSPRTLMFDLSVRF